MPTLPLAVDIADTVTEASENQTRLHVNAKAVELLQAHPEAEDGWLDVVDTLRAESLAAGVRLEAA